VYHRGFHGDLNETLFIGEVDERSKKLTRVTHEAIMAAIAIVKPGNKPKNKLKSKRCFNRMQYLINL
jgi:methionine aminopeptidase